MGRVRRLTRLLHHVRDAKGAHQRRFRENNDELFAAISGGEIARTATVPINALGDEAESVVPGRVAQRVVVFLEIIDIDHQHGESFARAVAARAFVREEFIERAAIGEARQPVRARGERKPLGELTRLGFRRASAAKLHAEQDREREERGAQQKQNRAKPNRARLPWAVNFAQRRTDRNHKRQIADPRKRIIARHAAGLAIGEERSDAGVGKVLEQSGAALVGAYVGEPKRVPQNQGAIFLEDPERSVGPQRQIVEQGLEVRHIDRARDDPAEGAVGLVDAPAQHDGDHTRREFRPDGAAYEQFRARVVAVDLEILPIEHRNFWWFQRGGIRHDIAALVNRQEPIEVSGAGREVEHHHLTRGGRRGGELRRIPGGDRAAKGKVEQFEIARDIVRDGANKARVGTQAAVQRVVAGFVEEQKSKSGECDRRQSAEALNQRH